MRDLTEDETKAMDAAFKRSTTLVESPRSPGCSIQERQHNSMTRDSYCEVVLQDIAWLDKQPDSLEKQHIERVLKHSVHLYYPKN
jgi:hypothetical protein